MCRPDCTWFRKKTNNSTTPEVIASSRYLGQDKRIVTTSRSLQVNRTNGSIGGELGFVNPSAERDTYEIGELDVARAWVPRLLMFTVPAPNRDVKNAILTFTSIFHVRFIGIQPPKYKTTKIREPFATSFAQNSGTAVSRVGICGPRLKRLATRLLYFFHCSVADFEDKVSLRLAQPCRNVWFT